MYMKLKKDSKLATRKAEGKKKASSALKAVKKVRLKVDVFGAAGALNPRSWTSFLRLYSSKTDSRRAAKVLVHEANWAVRPQVNAM